MAAQLKVLPGVKPVKVKHDGKVAISTGGSRFEKKWRNQEIEWSALVARLSKSLQTKETYEEYVKWGKSKATKEKQDNVKDVGGFVGGYVPGGRRLKGVVKERQLITLDADHMKEGESLDDKMLEIDGLDVGFVVYSTHKNTPKAPRQRLIIPMTRIVSADEYEAIARKIADKIGIDLFDDSTYEAHRLMYWPSHSFDAEPFFYFFDAEFLDPDKILSEYPDWTDTSFWAYSSRVTEIKKREMDKAGDPFEKPGVIGAFNRAHPIREVLETTLADVYTPCASSDRFTYIEGSTSAGLVLYEDEGFVYSHHSTDPAAGLSNAFDLVRIHKFGELDENADPAKGITKMPSYKAMVDYAREDEGTRLELGKAASEEAIDFDDGFVWEDDEEADDSWKKRISYKKDGTPEATAKNALAILGYCPELRSIRLNLMSGMIEAEEDSLPWKRDFKYWQNRDTDQLYMWIANHLNVQLPKELFLMALSTVANKRRFHPVKDYLESLPEWDGAERIAGTLEQYLGADDSIFSREALAKVMIAAIARVYHPGIKFDYMLVLNGGQGIGKSTFFERLFKGFFSDNLSMLDMRDKTGQEKLQGYWALEVGEMAGMKKADIESVKSFISRQEDVYRPAYGRTTERHPRQCVIVGSTNSDSGFLRDITGNRRFWPIKCSGKTEVKPWDLDEDTVAQLWAEALHRYNAGEPLLLSAEAEKIAYKKQREALEEDPRTAQVIDYLSKKLPENWDSLDLDTRLMYLNGDMDYDEDKLVDRQQVSNMEIWVECLGRRREDLKRADADALTALMLKLEDWERTGAQKRISIYGKQNIYKRNVERVEREFSEF